MTRKDTNMTRDLQKFIDKFEPNKFKLMAKGIEIRGINDIHRGVTFAKELIDKMKLKLIVNHTADMVGYGAFEVNNM